MGESLREAYYGRLILLQYQKERSRPVAARLGLSGQGLRSADVAGRSGSGVQRQLAQLLPIRFSAVSDRSSLFNGFAGMLAFDTLIRPKVT